MPAAWPALRGIDKCVQILMGLLTKREHAVPCSFVPDGTAAGHLQSDRGTARARRCWGPSPDFSASDVDTTAALACGNEACPTLTRAWIQAKPRLQASCCGTEALKRGEVQCGGPDSNRRVACVRASRLARSSLVVRQCVTCASPDTCPSQPPLSRSLERPRPPPGKRLSLPSAFPHPQQRTLPLSALPTFL